MILGITGGTGCGKTTLLKEIEEMGGLVLDCDAIYHSLLKTDAELLHAIDSAFPGVVESGSLNRKKLGSIVFQDKTALEQLNRITHCAIKAEVVRQLSQAPALAAIDAIALFEAGLAELCDITVAVTAPEEERVRRLMRRDSISREYAESRIAAQHPAQWFEHRCDYCLQNDGTAEQFRIKCLAFLQSPDIMKENRKGDNSYDY